MDINHQLDQAVKDIALAFSAFAVAVVLVHSVLTSLDSSKAIGERHSGFEKVSHVVELPKAMTQPLVECDTDLDCTLKNPQINPDNFMDSED